MNEIQDIEAGEIQDGVLVPWKAIQDGGSETMVARPAPEAVDLRTGQPKAGWEFADE